MYKDLLLSVEAGKMIMEQYTEENTYVVDLGEINSAADIIFNLSSLLDNSEARNKKICLKLGNVDLNQAQILSIKSLINGINSILSSIDTKSAETEKVALSLGIIVSNVSPENITEVNPEVPYKTAEEFKNETHTEVQEEIKETEVQEHNENREISTNEPVNTEIAVENIQNTTEEQVPTEDKTQLQDELEVIFGSDPAKTSIFNMEIPEDLYEEKEGITDIIVPEQEYTKEDIELESFPTKYIKQTIRSGQVINYEGNIVIIGDCHPGCEISAFGDITVWGVLSGIAHAGSAGNQKARVRALKMNAIQLRIANCYSRRPDSLNTVYIEKTNSFTPEEARIINGEIVVFKIND